MNQPACPFCHLPKKRVFLETAATRALLDAFPITGGHALVIPTGHVVSIFELPVEEFAALSASSAL